MIVKDLKHVEELLLRTPFKSGRIGLPRSKSKILNNYRICDGKYLVKQVNATNKATVQRFMLGKLKLKVLRRKYICSVQTHFTRTRRCPWRCSCTETRTGTETSRTSFRMSWTCSWTPGCRSECTVEAESWALVSISCSPAGSIIITMTTLLTLPPAAPRPPPSWCPPCPGTTRPPPSPSGSTRGRSGSTAGDTSSSSTSSTSPNTSPGQILRQMVLSFFRNNKGQF